MTRRPWTGSCKVQPLLELEGFGCLSSVVPFVDHVSRSKRQTAQQPDVNKGCHLCGIAKFYNRKQQREHFKGKRHLAMQSGTPDSSISKGAPQDTQQVADAGPQDEAEILDLNDEMEQMLGFSRFNSTRKEKRKKKRKKGSNIFENNTVPFGKENFGYWAQRYRLFSRFDEGIQMDKVGWYSVTPEMLAEHIASRVQEISPTCTVVDAFCGVGGNTIQFAKWGFEVYAIELDEGRLEMAKHNAQIYGVHDKIKWIHGDCLEVLPTLKADVVFLSPPWGGPQYKFDAVFDLKSIEPDFGTTFFKALSVTPNIIAMLPRNSDLTLLQHLAYQSKMVSEVKQKFGGGSGHEGGMKEDAKEKKKEKEKKEKDDMEVEVEGEDESDKYEILMEVENNKINGKANSITVYFGGFKFNAREKSGEVLKRVHEEWLATENAMMINSSFGGKENVVEAIEEEEEVGEVIPLTEEERAVCEANIKLRERMLSVYLAMVGQKADMQLYERTNVSGKFGGIDGPQEYMHVTELQTPMYLYPEATLRVSDIRVMRFGETNQ